MKNEVKNVKNEIIEIKRNKIDIWDTCVTIMLLISLFSKSCFFAVFYSRRGKT